MVAIVIRITTYVFTIVIKIVTEVFTIFAKIATHAFRGLAYAIRGLFSLIILFGQKVRSLKPRFPAWRPRLNFQAPKLDLTPAMRFGRKAFFFLAGLGGMVLKALLSALIFLLQQRRQLLKLRLRSSAIEPAIKPTTEPTIKPTVKPIIKPALKSAIQSVLKSAANFDLRRTLKYGGGALAVISVFVIVTLNFATIQRSWASWRAKAGTDEIKIQEDYQNASRKTLVKLEPLQVLGKPSDGLSMGASFNYAGRILKQDPTSITLLLTSVAKEFKYDKQHHLTATADGETIKLGAMNRAGKQVEVLSDGSIETAKPSKKGAIKGDHVLETLTLNVPMTTLAKIAWSKKVKMKLGETEFDLTDTHLIALREMLVRATPEPAKEKPKTQGKR